MTMSFKSVTPIFALTVGVLSGCSEENKSSAVVIPPPKLISELSFESSTLKYCVLDTARRANIEYVSDFKSLACSAIGHGLSSGFHRFGTEDERDDPTSNTVNSTVGLEQLTELEVLDLSLNWISKIDLSKLKNLKRLTLHGSIIQSLDLAHNSELLNVSIGCSPFREIVLPVKSQLTHLTVSGSGNGCGMAYTIDDAEGETLADEFLNTITGERLTTSDYELLPLTYLDFSGQEKLQSITITGYTANASSNTDLFGSSFPKNNSVIYLDLSSNKIQNISLSVFKGLSYLDLRYNSLDELDLSNSMRLRELNVRANDLTNLILDIENSELMELDYSGNPSLVGNIGYLPKLQKLSLSGDVSGEGLTLNTPNLAELHITGGNLLDSNFPSDLVSIGISHTTIKQRLQINLPSLWRLSLYDNELKELDVSMASSLTRLNIEQSDIDDLDLSMNSSLVRLSVASSPIADGHLLLPPLLEGLFLSDLGLTTLNTAELGVNNLISLSLKDMAMTVVEVAEVDPLFKDLNFDNLDVVELDLRAFSEMTGSLIIRDCPLQAVQASGLESVTFSILDSLRLDSDSRQLLNSLLGAVVN